MANLFEKFIGDVVAIFGAPVTHEDDPERAVRAALAVRDAIRTGTSRLPADQPGGAKHGSPCGSRHAPSFRF